MYNFMENLAKEKQKAVFNMVFEKIENQAWNIAIATTKKDRTAKFEELQKILRALHEDVEKMF